MKNLETITLSIESKIQDAIKHLDNNLAHIVLITDNYGKLLGTITDGDVRRGLLRGIGLESTVDNVMNKNPTVALEGENIHKIYALMHQKKIRQIPIVDSLNHVIRLEIMEDILLHNKKNNPVVLMAGGLSTRLKPLTDDCPKPMLKIGGKPLLETILTNLIEYGFQEFYISVNYLAQQIKDYFGNGEKWNVEIHYLHENNKLGTAGALSLLPTTLQHPILVMNSDLLTKIDFDQLLRFHHEEAVDATMCVRNFDYTLPYGICELNAHRITSIVEKPTYQYFINAGVYLLNPKLLKQLSKNAYLDMPNFLSLMIKNQHNVAAFPVREYWLDIGQLADFERAHQEYNDVFEVEI